MQELHRVKSKPQFGLRLAGEIALTKADLSATSCQFLLTEKFDLISQYLNLRYHMSKVTTKCNYNREKVKTHKLDQLIAN